MKSSTKNSSLINIIIWFSAAVCVDEIITGSFAADLGVKDAVLAIILGHFIGCLLLLGAALIGAKANVNAMNTVKHSFGNYGASFFSFINVLQLVGWTSVMLVIGANTIKYNTTLQIDNYFWMIMLAVLLIFWVLIGEKFFKYVNYIAGSLLLLVIIYFSFEIFINSSAITNFIPQKTNNPAVTFGTVVELSVAMPLSWIPLISDYIVKYRSKTQRVKISIISSISYFVASTWMYLLGYFGTISIGVVDQNMNLMFSSLISFVPVIVIVVALSTVTTSFLDVYSATESIFVIGDRKIQIPKKVVSLLVCIIGLLIGSLITDAFMNSFENFLYLIGACFSPMITIMLVDYFILKKSVFEAKISLRNSILWLIGFFIYEIPILMNFTTIIGTTIPSCLVIALITVLVHKIGIVLKKNKK